MKNNNTQLTNQDLLESLKVIIEDNNALILQSISQFSSETDQRFNGIEDRLGNIETELGEVTLRLDNKVNKFDFDELENKVDLLITN